MTQNADADQADISQFIQRIQSIARTNSEALSDFFVPAVPISIARAPGRLDVMGGIADYSGSLVLQLPIAEATFAAVQRSADDNVAIISLASETERPPRAFSIAFSELAELAKENDSDIQTRFPVDAADQWAAYVAGTIVMLARERAIPANGGLRILVQSEVPEAVGVSSSAAVEVAALRAIARTWDVELPGHDLARICQLAENHVAGAPCGIMDQMTAALGRADHLLALLCQPAEIKGHVSIPPAIRFWGIDSGIRHAVSGADYTSVRTGAFMGYRIIAELAGLQVSAPRPDGTVHVEDAQWRGYLANLSPEDFAEKYTAQLPAELAGDAFLQQYAGTTDSVTRVRPDQTYPVRQPTEHPIYEHARVQRFADLLGDVSTETTLAEMGDLMYASHASYSACGLESDGTDLLVQLVQHAGPRAGLYGAKITGGGSGGTVAVLGRADAEPAVKEIAAEYARQTGHVPKLFTGSSDGACYLKHLSTEVL
jgi:L-arabinokinase